MWLSEQFHDSPTAESAGFGEVTIGGSAAATMSAGHEQRLLPIISPGGYAWLPEAGEEVLVLHEGAPCILGRRQTAELSPGEVMLYAGASAIRLHTDGTIELCGRVLINGVEFGGISHGQ